MSATKHSAPKRLAIFEGFIASADDDGSVLINSKFYGEEAPNSKYLVAAYNDLVAERDRYKAERDELLAALKGILKIAEHYTPAADGERAAQTIYARALIAKIEGAK